MMLSDPMLEFFPLLLPLSPTRADIWAWRLLISDFPVDERADYGFGEQIKKITELKRLFGSLDKV